MDRRLVNLDAAGALYAPAAMVGSFGELFYGLDARDADAVAPETIGGRAGIQVIARVLEGYPGGR